MALEFSDAFLLPSGASFAPPAPAAANQLRGSWNEAAPRAPAARSQAGSLATVGVATLAAAAVVESARSRRSTATRTARRAAGPFAGGLIGSESAFSSGDYNFDPLGLSVKLEQDLPWLRESELKHGRVAMLAWVGMVVPDFVRIPSPDPCYKASIIDAFNVCLDHPAKSMEGIPKGPLVQVFLLCLFLEIVTTGAKTRIKNGLTLENAGDYQFGVGFLPKDDLKAKEMKLKELKNGRLAMIAFGGAITQAALSGNGFPWLYSSERPQRKAEHGSALAAGRRVAPAGPRTALRAAPGGYKMSNAVPFLPVSPALEGYAGGDEEGFDPMGVSLAIDIRWLRESELKHGRVAMLAVVGWIATDMGLRIPGALYQVSTVEAHDALVKAGVMPHMLVWFLYAELFGFLAVVNMMEGKTDRQPGDFYLHMLYPSDAKAQKEMQMKELRNGRLAMLAFGGIVTSAVLTGKVWPFFATAPDARRSAPSVASVLCGAGVARSSRGPAVAAKGTQSASVPFLPKPEKLKGLIGEEKEFDPLGFSDIFDVRYLRESELKHGRVCMLATVGFLAQQYVTFPDFPATPNALDSLYTSPVSGLATLLFICGFIESASYGGKITMLDMFEGSSREPGFFGFGTWFYNGKSEKEIKEIKAKEIENGRLAMFAIGGMVHHNLVVKGPLFPLIPDGWEGPQGSWAYNSVLSGILDDQIRAQV